MDIWLFSSLGSALVGEGLAGSSLLVDEFALYGMINDLGPVTATQLLQWTGLPSTTISAMLRRCEARGEVVRTPNPADRRSALIELTADGQKAYDDALPALSDALRKLNGHLDIPEDGARAVVQEIDTALRSALALPARPYKVPADTGPGGLTEQIPLTAAQLDEVHAFARWVQFRDSRRPRPVATP